MVDAVIQDRQKLAQALALTEYIAVVEASYGCPRPILITVASDDKDAMGQARNACQPWETVSALYKLVKITPGIGQKERNGDEPNPPGADSRSAV